MESLILAPLKGAHRLSLRQVEGPFPFPCGDNA